MMYLREIREKFRFRNSIESNAIPDAYSKVRGDRVAFHQTTYAVYHSLDTQIQMAVKSARV